MDVFEGEFPLMKFNLCQIDQKEDWISISLNIDGNKVTSCVGVRNELLITITNKTYRWLRCKLEPPQKLDNVYINMTCRSDIIDPHDSKCTKIEVAPQNIGDMIISINVIVEDIKTKANKITDLSLNLCGLEPKIEITSESSPESPSVLNFGYLPECCHHTHTLAVKNLSNCDIPLLFTIKKQSNNLQMFSVLETPKDSINCSQLEKNTSASCILYTGQTLAITVIFSSPKINLLNSQSGKADVSALLDIELAESLSNIILKEITLMGKVGYTELLLNAKYIPLVFIFEHRYSNKRKFPIKNGGCVPLNLAIKVDGTSIADCLAIKPNRLHIPPGRKSFIELHFQPKTEHPCEGKLLIEVEPNGEIVQVNVIGTRLATPFATPFATPNVKSGNNLWDIYPSLVVLMPPHIVNAGLIITNKFQTSQTFEAEVSNSYLQVEPSYGTIHPNDEVMITVSCSLSFKTREKVLESVLRIYIENNVKEVKVHIYASN